MLGSRHAGTATTGARVAQSSSSASLVLLSRRFEFIDCKPQLGSFQNEVCAGLACQPKMLEAKFFYDEEGSRLFEQICELPEYYPTRSEVAILETSVEEIKAEIGEDAVLIEFGSGNSQKIRLLLDQLIRIPLSFRMPAGLVTSGV